MASPDLSGSGADLYIIKGASGKLVRRVPKKAAYSRSIAEQVKFESSVMSYLSGNDFAAKFVSSNSESIIYEYISGRELFYSADGKKMGEALSALHNFSSARTPNFAKYVNAREWISSSLARHMAELQSKSTISMQAKKFAQGEIAAAEKSLSKAGGRTARSVPISSCPQNPEKFPFPFSAWRRPAGTSVGASRTRISQNPAITRLPRSSAPLSARAKARARSGPRSRRSRRS